MDKLNTDIKEFYEMNYPSKLIVFRDKIVFRFLNA